MKKRIVILSAVLCVFFLALGAQELFASAAETYPLESESSLPWWAWPLILLVVTFVMGIVAVLGGVGGGVLFVPIISGFFPFHLDFVRGAGLAIPVAVIASSCAIVGAMIGLALPTHVVQVALGATILGIVIIMLKAKKSEFPEVPKSDTLSSALRITGVYHEVSSGEDVNWKIHRTPQGLFLFIIIGVMAGMFGLGAGWANVPVLNLLMGAPLKVSVATSKFLLSITDTSAAWIYINNGAVLPMMVVPSVIGIMLGSLVGVRILAKTKPAVIRWIVITILLFAGGKALQKGIVDWPSGDGAVKGEVTQGTQESGH
jgi:uncharacterized membrane protein YfcA